MAVTNKLHTKFRCNVFRSHNWIVISRSAERRRTCFVDTMNVLQNSVVNKPHVLSLLEKLELEQKRRSHLQVFVTRLLVSPRKLTGTSDFAYIPLLGNFVNYCFRLENVNFSVLLRKLWERRILEHLCNCGSGLVPDMKQIY